MNHIRTVQVVVVVVLLAAIAVSTARMAAGTDVVVVIDNATLCAEGSLCTPTPMCEQTNNRTTHKCRPPEPAYEHVTNAPTASGEPPYEPIVDVALPACKNMTLQQSEFTVSSDGSTLTANIGRATSVLTDFRLLGGNGTNATAADVCLPLSPQLLQCPLRRLHMASYMYVMLMPGRTLFSLWNNDTIGVRDYYTTGPIPSSDDDDVVLACNDSINVQRKLRCNYLDYTPDEYKFVDNGLRLWLLPSNTSIYRPEYTSDTSAGGNGTIDVCYPFTPAFTRCDLWMLETYEFYVRPDRRLVDTVHDNVVHDMGDYFIYPNGQAVVCAPPPNPLLASTAELYYIHAVLYLVSAVCLFVAFVVHLVVPSLNFHAKPLLCHMMCMTIMYTALATRKFAHTIDPTACYVLFVVTYYSSMASFFWLNVLSFDLWSIFANLQTTASQWRWCTTVASLCTCSCSASRRFQCYCLYALGLPALFSMVAVIVDKDASLQDALHLYPNLPAMCWFNNRHAAYAFLYIPMFIVLGVNLALFMSTVYNLRQASRGAEVVNKKLNTQLLIVCFKLFIIMGFCWIGEAVAWTSGKNVSAYYVPDAINAIQGIIIFLIYICKPATYRLLRKKFCPAKNSDGKWTTDFNTSRKTSSSGLSMAHVRDSSVRSTVTMVNTSSLRKTDGSSTRRPNVVGRSVSSMTATTADVDSRQQPTSNV